MASSYAEWIVLQVVCVNLGLNILRLRCLEFKTGLNCFDEDGLYFKVLTAEIKNKELGDAMIEKVKLE